MSIIRIKHNRENPFVQLNKKALWDENLSLQAIGLWARCMSRPDNWIFNISEMVASSKEGKDAIYNTINELIKNGYCLRVQAKNKSSGLFDKVEYYFYEFKLSPEEIEELKKCLPLPPLPDTVEPHTVNPPLLRNKDTNKDINKKKEVEEKVAKAPTTINFLLISSRSNVKLTQKEIDSLKQRFKEDYDKCIEHFSQWLESSGKKRRSHYRAILKWIPDWLADQKIDEDKEKTVSKYKAFAIKVKNYIGDQLLKIYQTGVYQSKDKLELSFNMPYEDFCRCLAKHYGINNYQGDM